MSTPDSKKSESLLKPHEIRDLRERLNQSQVQFAKELGVNPTYISQLESGIRPVSAKISRAIHRIMEEKTKKVNFDAPVSYEVRLMVESWVARVKRKSGHETNAKEFINLCLVAYGEKFCDRMIEEFNSAVDIAAAKTFQIVGQGILPPSGEAPEQPPRGVQLKPKAEQDSGKK